MAYDLNNKNLYLLGTAEFGPTNTPIKITNEIDLYSIFGNEGSLIEAYNQVVNVTNDINLFLCKTTGSHAIAYLNINTDTDVIPNALIIKSKYSSHIYNNIAIKIESDAITFIMPNELDNETIKYYYDDYMTLESLITKINEDTENGLNHVYAQCFTETPTYLIGALDTVNPSIVYLSGGDNGLVYNKNQYYYCLEETYSLLEGREIDVIVPLEAYIDDIYLEKTIYGDTIYNSKYYVSDRDYLTIKDNNGNKSSFYKQLLKFCIKQYYNGYITYGVMGYNIVSLEDIDDEYIHDIAILTLNENIKTLEAELKEFRYMINAVAQDLLFNFGEYLCNAYIAYAAMIANSNIYENLTNKKLPENIILLQNITQEQINELSKNGIVCFRNSAFYKCVVVSHGVTTYDYNTDLHLLCNVRMIQHTVNNIKRYLEKYIGEDIVELYESKVIQEELKILLDEMLELNIINSYDVSIENNIQNNEIIIDLKLKTMYMIEAIDAISSIKYNKSEVY